MTRREPDQPVLVLNGMMSEVADELFRAAGLAPVTMTAHPAPDAYELDRYVAMVPRIPAVVTHGLLEAMPRLRVISTIGVGYENIDMAAATALGIPVVNQPGVGKEPVAEHAVALMLALARDLVNVDRDFRARGWKAHATYLGRASSSYGFTIAGRVLGIIGLGHVGARIAEICRLAFGMRVIAYSPSVPPERFAELQAERRPDAASVCREADFVVLAATARLGQGPVIGVAEIAAMQPTACLINVARGAVVDQPALLAALQARRIAGAGLDVFNPEPPPHDDPLLQLDNVIVTPHCAGISSAVSEALTRSTISQIRQVLDGERPPHLLNPETWPRRRSAAGT